MPRFLFLFLCALGCGSSVARADALSKSQKVDFFREVSSRNIAGLATRSDGRLISGPVLRKLEADFGTELMWDIEPLSPGNWLVSTGPSGVIKQVTLPDLSDVESAVVETWAEIATDHVFVIKHLGGDRILAGGSPRGGLYLLAAGEVVAAVNLPVDSILDILVLDAGTALVATGNPGRIYRVDLAVFESTQPVETPNTETGLEDDAVVAEVAPVPWTERGISEFGAIRDRNVRRLARDDEGRVLAGSAPDGNLYRFPVEGGAPLTLFNHDRAEVTDIFVADNNDVFASVVSAGTPGSNRVIRSATLVPETAKAGEKKEEPKPLLLEPAPQDIFAGRSSLIKLAGGDGLPETVASRGNLAFYRIVERGSVLMLAGGDDGDLVGYDRATRRALTFGGSDASQLSDLVATDDASKYLVMTNNPSGIAVLDFQAPGPRTAETRRIDLRSPGHLGAVRFGRLRGLRVPDLNLELRANRGNDENEGWTDWSRAEERDGGWYSSGLTGQYLQLRVTLPETISPDLQLDSAMVYHLPQNRRPVLQRFRIISPNFGLIPRAENTDSAVTTLGQVIGETTSNNANNTEAQRERANFLASNVVPRPGAQIVTWTVNDADEDNLRATFSLRHEDSEEWIDMVVNTTAPWVQFDRSALPDGVYFTRLVITEAAPRPKADRLRVEFETDDLLVDQSPPELLDVAVATEEGRLGVRVDGRDAMSLLYGVDLVFNNGFEEAIEQPADGIRDGRTETFFTSISAAALEGATSVEVRLFDASGNRTARRVDLPAFSR